MQLKRGALKFALMVLAVVFAFAGATNINRSKAFDREALKFEVTSSQEPKANGPTDIYTVSLTFSPKLKSDQHAPDLEISFIEARLLLKGEGGLPLGEEVVLVRETNRLVRFNERVVFAKPLNQYFPLFSSQTKTAEVVVTELTGQVTAEDGDDREVSLGDVSLANLVIHISNITAPPLTIERPFGSAAAGGLAQGKPAEPEVPAVVSADTLSSPTATPLAPTLTPSGETNPSPTVSPSPISTSVALTSSSLPPVAITSIDLAAASGAKHRLTITGATEPNTLVELTIQSNPQSFRVLADSVGNFVVRADVQLRPGSHQVFGRAITPDSLEVGPVSTTVEFTIPASQFGGLRDTLVGGGLVILGILISMAGLLL